MLAGGGGRGYLGQGQAAAWALPDGDDLLGLTAHTPGQPLQPPATPVQDGRLDRAAADTANTQSPARSHSSLSICVNLTMIVSNATFCGLEYRKLRKLLPDLQCLNVFTTAQIFMSTIWD